jgi:hypothetical protein
MNRQTSARVLATLSTFAFLITLSFHSQAQDSTPPRSAPAHIQWRLIVLNNGEEVDHLSAVTAVGQAKTITHQHSVSHTVGCNGTQTLPVQLARTVTVSPLGVDLHGVIGLDITAEEAVESAESGTIRSDGCTLSPQTRSLSAHHPELDVQSGQSVSWILLKKDPELVYRVEATVVPPSADD